MVCMCKGEALRSMKTEQEYFDEYRSQGKSRAQARNMANRRFMTDVIRDLRTNQPEKYARLVQKTRELEVEEAQRLSDQQEFKRLQAELRGVARYRLEHSLTCCGVPLPSFDLSPLIIDGYCGEQGADQVVVSFRQWNITASGHLHGIGVGSNYMWKEVNFANQVPSERNQNGLYSIRLDPHGLLTQAGSYVGDYCGLLELRGTVLEHEDGVLRSEYARILCVWVTEDGPTVFETVPVLYHNYPDTPIFVCTRRQVAEALFRVVAMQEFRK